MKKMRKDVGEIRKLLKTIDETYEKDPKVPEQVEEYRKKYATLTQKDLYKPFTI